uniref:Uncharacterized protein n=1 Tax=Arundo donax TaxID=35708 RepID=A0A0A9GJ36_ARUDO
MHHIFVSFEEAWKVVHCSFVYSESSFDVSD